MDKIKSTYRRLLKDVNYKHHRYIYADFNIDDRLTGLIGPRGVGKTVLLLQYIKEEIKNIDEAIYVSVDNIYFSQNNLLDFVNDLYEVSGVKYFFLDEIHKYPNWMQELKNIYDSYPDVKVVFSGSSSLDLLKGTYDFSRRGTIFKIKGMSFREYLLFKNIADIQPISLNELTDEKSKKKKNLEKELEKIPKIKGYFKEYLTKGYYPFVLEDKKTYYQKLHNIIEKTIYEDISNYYKLKTENLIYFKKIISYLATIPPSELNRNNIAKNIGLDNKTIQNYLNILNEIGLVNLIRRNKSGSNLLKSVEKIYLNNPDIYQAIVEEIGYTSKVGTIREIFFINMILNSGNKIFYSKIGDFEVNENYFEIGGQNKTKKQIKNHLDVSFVVKDNILYSDNKTIPLIFFGFLY